MIDVLAKNWLPLCGLGFLGFTMFLRILAMYRQQEVEPYEVARRARALRRQYFQERSPRHDGGNADEIVV